MATYRYACTNEECDEREFTFRRSMDEHDQPAPCPKCGTQSARLKSDFCKNFQLKGAFWYRDGYSGASHHLESAKAGKDPFK